MLHLVINPTAGNGRGAKIGQRMAALLDKQGVDHVAHRTEAAGHATWLAREAVQASAETVIAIGGDGTVTETARGLYGSGSTLGIIPAGTGNDFSRVLGIPKKPEEALSFLLSKKPRPVDMAWVNDTIFQNVCGTGFDVCVLDHSIPAKRYVRGMLPYLWGVICTIFSYRPVEVTFEVDGESPFTKRLLLLAIANGRYMGGGIDVAPHAAPNDGLFDLITIDSMPNWRLPFQLPKLLSGRIERIPGVEFRRCRRVVMTAKDMRLNMDGEVVPMERATLEVLPGALMAHW